MNAVCRSALAALCLSFFAACGGGKIGGRRRNMGMLAEEKLETLCRSDRKCHSRDLPADGAGGCESLCRDRGLVWFEVDGAQGKPPHVERESEQIEYWEYS